MSDIKQTNRIYAILGDVKRGAITIELGAYNIQDIIDLAIEQERKEIKEELKNICNRCKTERGLSRAILNLINNK